MARCHVVPIGAGARWRKLVRLWAACTQPFPVASNQEEKSDAGPACATISCDSQVLPPTRVCHLAVGMVDGRDVEDPNSLEKKAFFNKVNSSGRGRIGRWNYQH